MHCAFPRLPLKALEPHAVHPLPVASPPYPAEHSHRLDSEFNSLFVPQTQESELVALKIPSAIEDPPGHAVHCVFPPPTLKALEPHALQPTLNEVASPPYPAEHSQRSVSEFNSAFPPQTQESELVAVVTESPI